MKKLLLLGLGLGLALLISTRDGPVRAVAAPGEIVVVPPAPAFYVRSYGGKCLDFGPPPQVIGSPVFIYNCNGAIAQQVRVEEVNARHDVILRAGNKVIGFKPNLLPFPSGPAALAGVAPESEMSLELQNEASHLTVLFTRQVFALDGDSIILASNRNLVFKVQNNRGANRTPIVLRQRDLADSEFWTFTATDGLNRKPTSGFVHVSQAQEFVSAVQQAQPGTVIEVDPDASIELTDYPNQYIPTGVTIRGDRRGTRLGPELWTKPTAEKTMLDIVGDDVRITGLRLRGPSRSTDGDGPDSRGILANDKYLRSIIDHNDISDWTDQAVDVYGDQEQPEVCRDHRDPRGTRPQNVRVVRNFIHHNRKQEKGYGVEAHYGGFPLIEGNTFVSNRHSIMADGKACTSYLAYDNLVLSDAPAQEKLGGIISWHTQDFDVHGTGTVKFSIGVHTWDIGGFSGHAGQYFEIARNTFLGTNRQNFDLRGEPSYLAELHHNISLQSLGAVIACSYCGDGINKLKVSDTNQFEAANPTNRLGVGDFDGDGREDLFLATGAAWYYAPAGNAEWRLLSAQSEGIGSLLFGDFDGDGRTDVFTQHGRDWFVSWGGASMWEKINESAAQMTDFAIGDFDGDHRADVFYADGQTWFVSSGGIAPFAALDTSSFRVADLRFGDFNGDGKTDVFSVVSGQWMVAYSGTSGWQPLRAKLTDNVANLTVADFNGDRHADVATSSCAFLGCRWRVSYSGTGNWTTTSLLPSPVAAVGRFDGNDGADMLLWHDSYLDIASGGSAAPHRQSRQDMR